MRNDDPTRSAAAAEGSGGAPQGLRATARRDDVGAADDRTSPGTAEAEPRLRATDHTIGRGQLAPPRVPAGVPRWLVTSAAIAWRLVVVVAALYAVLWLLNRVPIVTLPLAVATVLATLCWTPAHWLRDRGWRPAAAAGAVVVGGLVVVAGLVSLLGAQFVAQLGELAPTVSAAVDDVLDFVQTGPLGLDPQQIQDAIASAQEEIGTQGGELASRAAEGVVILAELITGVVLTLVVLFFFVKDGPVIVDWGIARTPERYRDVVRALGRRAWVALGGFVRGTAIIALVDATLIGIGLLIIGVPLVLPLMFLIFLGGFLPVIGAFISGLLAVLVALATLGPIPALITFAVVVGVQQVDSHFLQPTVMKRAVSLHPVVVLTAIAAGAALLGIAGAFLAVPLAAVAAAVGNELRLRHEAEQRGDLETARQPESVGPVHAPVEEHEVNEPGTA